MNEVNNTLKIGLITATTTVTIGILNETYVRPESNESAGRKAAMVRRQQRGLAHIRSPAETHITAGPQHRNLAYYTTEYPVNINRVLDIYSGCPIGQKCVLVISSIPVVLESGDDPDEVKGVIAGGMQSSVNDGSFFAAIPPGTVDCPTV